MSSKIKLKRVALRKKSVLPLRVKIEILDRLRQGESFASISRSFKINESTVRSIKKSESKIRSSIASTSLSSKIVRDPAIEKMEVALSLWIQECNQKMVPLNGPMVREKAKYLYTNFKEPDGSGEYTDGGFQASEGWFNKFKARQSLHNVKLVEEAAFADRPSPEQYSEQFANLVAEGGYKPEQVFNIHTIELFWKRMPKKTFIYKSEKSACGFKAAKDRVTLLLCSNASGDCVIKPLMLYSLLNPQALINQNKNNLPVFWRANKKGCITSAIFCDWFRTCFVSEVKTYLKKQNLYFKALLVLEDEPAHSRKLEIMHPSIKVTFLPPSITAVLEPMNQGIIQVFKLYYMRRTFKILLNNMEYNPDLDLMESWRKFDIAKCIVNIKESLDELDPHTLKSCWNKLWPVVTTENDEPVQVQNLMANIVEIANEIGRDGFELIELSDIQELLETQDEALTETDLEKMLNVQLIEEETPTGTDIATFNLKNLSKGLRMANELCEFFVNIDPSMERSLIFKKQIANATALYHSELKVLLQTVKQDKITKFFKPLPKP
ncbi:tigger transposable element-derived protein 1-like [Ctenocephalides felis]|uniref:tigger transposable element-derived protein 1-like n=1 Tax=Ctenocephalides felis TaxID=7515 RepID=UPI000E6E273F|nr:tigger transposable element-derived protein 1-like [Ctenocephalides felis]XP_026474381.1 tigger transposable element-derived protein 1-like [Ctenocephalides felis]